MFTLAKACRLCFKNNELLVNYREVDVHNISLYDKIKETLPDLVTPYSEHYPNWICVTCCKELNQFYIFRKKCLDTDKLLKKYTEQLLSWEFLKTALNTDSEIITEDNDIFDTDTIPLDENSSDSNISIVKNEIPVTEEEELNFKLSFKSILQSETGTIGDNIVNNDDNNINEIKAEIQQQNISPVSRSFNEVRSLTDINTSLDKTKESSNQSIIIKNVNSIEDSQSSQETLQISSEGTDEKTPNSPILKLRRKRRFTSVSYNETSDNEDVRADDDRDFQSDDFDSDDVDSDVCSPKKKENIRAETPTNNVNTKISSSDKKKTNANKSSKKFEQLQNI